jgi:hypothetical protein
LVSQQLAYYAEGVACENEEYKKQTLAFCRFG